MPLSDMLKYMVESNDPANWEATRQKRLMGEMELQEKQRAMQANQQLRDLYAKGGQIDMGQVMAIDPATGIALQKAQNENLLQQMNMFKTQGDIEETKRKTQESKQHTFANTLGPLIENWQDSLGGRQPTAEDLESFKGRLGGALKFLDETYNYKPDVPIDPYHPEQLLGTAESLGYQSRRAKTAQELQLRGLPPQMSSEQYFGRENVTPEGYVTRTPGMGAQRQTPKQAAPQQPGMGREDLTEPQVQAYIDSLPEGPEKQRLQTIISGAQSMPLGSTSTVEVTPEELQKIRRFNKGEEVRTTKEVEADVQRTEEGKRITDAFKRAMGEGGVSRVMKLISESTSGKGEEVLAKARGAVPGLGATAGMENIGALNTIAGELRKTIERSPGAQSDKDVALAALDAAAIADPSIPYNQRMKGFLEFTRIIKERATDLGIDPQSLGINVDTETGSGPVKVKTKAEAEKLSPGTLFETPDGKIMRRH